MAIKHDPRRGVVSAGLDIGGIDFEEEIEALRRGLVRPLLWNVLRSFLAAADANDDSEMQAICRDAIASLEPLIDIGEDE